MRNASHEQCEQRMPLVGGARAYALRNIAVRYTYNVEHGSDV